MHGFVCWYPQQIQGFPCSFHFVRFGFKLPPADEFHFLAGHHRCVIEQWDRGPYNASASPHFALGTSARDTSRHRSARTRPFTQLWRESNRREAFGTYFQWRREKLGPIYQHISRTAWYWLLFILQGCWPLGPSIPSVAACAFVPGNSLKFTGASTDARPCVLGGLASGSGAATLESLLRQTDPSCGHVWKE